MSKIGKLTLACFLILLITLLFVFAKSLSPTERSINNLPRIKTDAIQNGSFAIFDDPYEIPALQKQDIITKLLAIRKTDNAIIVFSLAYKDNKILIPIDHYWNGGPTCDDFSPDFKENSISCKKTATGNSDLLKHKWSLAGISLTKTTNNLDQVLGMEENGFFIIHKR